jgi:hypothetical protein
MSVIDAHAPVVLEPADHVTTTTPPAAIVRLTHACLRRRGISSPVLRCSTASGSERVARFLGDLGIFNNRREQS